MPKPLPPRGQILDCLAASAKPLHAREIAEHLDVREAQYSRLLDLLDLLCVEGAVVRRSGQRFTLKNRRDGQTEHWTGILTVNPRGFGFVASAGRPDVYVAADGIGGALHGDTVTVSIVNKSSRGIEGQIIAVESRRNPRVAGTLRRRRNSQWLEPDDTRLRGPIVLQPSEIQFKDGMAAIAEITQFPDSVQENPEGILVSVLGLPGDPNVEVAKILAREQIVEEHPADAVKEAEAAAARLYRRNLQGRRDLRDIPLPTIDPEEARDHDDAIWVERLEKGYRAYVAIADVAEYVQPDSALDAEASSRGCTLYLPDRAVPMLPAALAADLCSLLPEKERLCLCVIADLDQKGQLVTFEIVEGVMRSAAMLTYGGVALALGFTTEGVRSVQAEAMRPGLRVLDELARKLRKNRMRRGALDLDLPEAHVLLDEATGAPTNVVRRAKDPGVKRAYQMVEELMLLANELVAQWLSSRHALGIYRVHATPDPEKLERLGHVAEQFGVRVDLEALQDPVGLSKWLESISEHPRRTVLESIALRSLKQAFYDIVNIGHFGLASDAYLHFTSPIRRYPDLIVHRIVKGMLRGGRTDSAPAAVENLRKIATHASSRERASMEVEREVVDVYRVVLMRDKVGEEFGGTVTAIVGSGVFVALDEPFVDVLVRLEGLGPDRYELAGDELSVIGVRSGDRVSLGERLRVVIEDVSIVRRQISARRVVVPVARGKRSRNGERTELRRPKAKSARSEKPRAGKPSRKSRKR
jgi:ribonuclease R